MSAVLDNLDLYAEGMWLTIQLTLLSYAAALLVGTVIAAMRISPAAPARAAGLVYVETVRNIPLLALLLLFVFGGPKAGVTFSLYTSAVIVLGAYHGAFVAETLRSGVSSVSKGQAEAARAIGLTWGQSMREVVLPQAFRTVVPPLGNIFIALTKNSSLAAVVGLSELTANAGRVFTETDRAVPVYLGAALAYLVLTVPSGLFFQLVERRVAILR